MQIPGLEQLPHARSVTMQVMQGFRKKNNAFYNKNRQNIANRVEWLDAYRSSVTGEFTKSIAYMYYSYIIIVRRHSKKSRDS